VVEHSLGKGEVDSSILSGSTILNRRKPQAGPHFYRRGATLAACGLRWRPAHRTQRKTADGSQEVVGKMVGKCPRSVPCP